MLKKYDDILNEKKDMKAEKNAVEEKIMKLFKDKPTVKAKSDGWPDAKCIYGMSSIKTYVGGDNLKVDQVFNEMRKDKKIKSISVRIKYLKESYPYYYHEDYTSKEEAQKCKEQMESSQKEVVKKVITPAAEPAAKPKAVRKPRVKKDVPTEAKAQAKAKAVIRRKK